MALRNNLEIMLQRGQDSPLLRFSLGSECLKDGDLVAAVDHLRQAVQLNAGYSAAWKVLGQAYSRTGASERAGGGRASPSTPNSSSTVGSTSTWLTQVSTRRPAGRLACCRIRGTRIVLW